MVSYIFVWCVCASNYDLLIRLPWPVSSKFLRFWRNPEANAPHHSTDSFPGCVLFACFKAREFCISCNDSYGVPKVLMERVMTNYCP